MDFPLAIIPAGFAALGGRQGCLGPFCSGISPAVRCRQVWCHPPKHNVSQIFVFFCRNRGLRALWRVRLGAGALNAPALSVYHDEDAEIYLDGNLVAQLPLYLGVYGSTPIPSFTTGIHTLALHCHQTVGGQGIDCGVLNFSQ